MNEASHLISPTELTEAETAISFTRPRSDSSSSTASSSSKSSSSSLGDAPRITFTGLENLDSLIDFFDERPSVFLSLWQLDRVNDSQDIDVGLKLGSKAAHKLKSLLKKGKRYKLVAENFISYLKRKFEKVLIGISNTALS